MSNLSHIGILGRRAGAWPRDFLKGGLQEKFWVFANGKKRRAAEYGKDLRKRVAIISVSQSRIGMPFSLNLRSLLAHWIPGFLLLAVLCFGDFQNHPDQISNFAEKLGSAGMLFGIAVGSFLAGLFLDALRNVFIEEFLCGKIKSGWGLEWDCIFRFKESNLKRLEEFYFLYYVVDTNLVLALIIALPTSLILGVFPCLSRGATISLIIAGLVFAADAIFLKKEMIEISKKRNLDVTE